MEPMNMRQTTILLAGLLVCLGASLPARQTDPRFGALRGPYLGQRPPGLRPTLFAPELLVMSKQAHSNIVFDEPGTEAFWCHNGIWHSRLEGEGWTAPRRLPFSREEFSDDAPFLSPDGQRLFFASKRPVAGSQAESKENVWVADRTADGWSEPRLLPAVVNDLFQHWQVSVDRDGALYFGRVARPGEDRDLYVSRRRAGAYQPPERLGPGVNSDLDERNPYVSPTGDYLVFSRQTKAGPGGSVLFVSFKRKDGAWSTAVPFGDLLPYEYGGNCPMVSPDGRYLFFLDVHEGLWQRFWVDARIIDRLRPKEELAPGPKSAVRP